MLKGKNIADVVAVCIDDKQKVTLASCIRRDGTVGKGRARCMEGDTYRPEVGAIIALCKAMGVKPAKACFDVMDVLAKREAGKLEKAKVKETQARVLAQTKVTLGVGPKATIKHGKVKVTKSIDPEDLKGMPVGSVKRGKCRLSSEFVGIPGDYGVMGKPTKFYDRNGERLYVGDLVTVDVLNGDVRTGQKWKAAPGVNFVVDEQSDDPVTKGAYIWGLCKGCDPKTGKIDKRFKVKKVKDWRQVEIGEANNGVKVVWEDEV